MRIYKVLNAVTPEASGFAKSDHVTTHTHTHTHSLSLSHTHTHTHAHPYTHTHTHTHTHSLSLSHTHTHTCTPIHTHTHTHTHSIFLFLFCQTCSVMGDSFSKTAMLYYDYHQGKFFQQNFQSLSNCLGDQSALRSTVHDWCKEFHFGRTKFEFSNCCGHQQLLWAYLGL